MRILACLLLLAVGGSAAAAPTGSAPVPTAAAETRATEAEALAFVKAYSPSDLRREAEIGLLRRDFVKGLRRQPASAEMLDTFPLLGDALTAAMESQIGVYIEEYDARFFPRATQIARTSLLRDDVLALTAFYRSALGRKMLASSAAKVDGSEIIDRAMAGQQVDAGVAKRQAFRAGMATYATLTPAERNQITAIAQTPAGRRFQAMMPQMIALQVELTNTPGPKFEAGAQAAMDAAFKRVTGTDPARP